MKRMRTIGFFLTAVVSAAVLLSCAAMPDVDRVAVAEVEEPVVEEVLVDVVTLFGHTEEGRGVDFSPCGRYLVSAGRDGKIIKWDVGSASMIWEIDDALGHRINHVGFTPDGTRIVAAGDGSMIRTFDAETGAVLSELDGQEGNVRMMKVSPHGNYFAIGNDMGFARVYELDTYTLVFEEEFGYRVRALEWHPVDPEVIAFGVYDGYVRIYDYLSGELLKFIDYQLTNLDMHDIAWTPCGKYLAYGGKRSEGEVFVWNEKYDTVEVIPGYDDEDNPGRIRSLMWTPLNKGDYLVSAVDSPHVIRIFDRKDLQDEVAVLEGHMDEIRTVRVSPDGTKIASIADDMTVRIWTVNLKY